MATLEALAVVLGADEAGWLLDRNPLVEGEVIDFGASSSARKTRNLRARS
jgi:hypothetical protein